MKVTERQYHAFAPWLHAQWWPFMAAMRGGERWETSLHFVIRYEDLFADPADTMVGLFERTLSPQ
eukprot:431974-Pyramimonas_sp.AAC.1